VDVERILNLPAVEQGRLIRTGQVTSEALTTAYLHRLESVGRKLNAVARTLPEQALEHARIADREIQAGHVRSAIHGVPYGAKDLFAVRDVPCQWGSPAHADQVFPYDAAAIQRLRDAGAVLLAKLAMIELAGGGGYEYASASITGPCLNPWNTERWAGGSSSGSGAAVAAGLVGFALGTETWGSITVPSAFCGITGLRPTYGRISRFGAMALSWTMDKIGPMARTAEDCAALLKILAGPDARDPSASSKRFTYSLGKVPHGLRLGVLPTDFATNGARSAERAFQDACSVFTSRMRAELGEAKLPDFPYDAAADTIISVEGASAFQTLIRSPKLGLLRDRSQQAGLLAGLAIPGVEYLHAMRIRALAAPQAVAIFQQFDALIAPTLLHGAPPVSKSLNESWAHTGGNGGPGNLLGWPSVSVPMGFDEDGLPLGLEIIGAPYEEATILRLAHAFQQETDWHKRVPPAGRP
jgi:aspartyl-tRNA(Asn)/glutamyl-tRNA(Gln) amidotransferase subunit A